MNVGSGTSFSHIIGSLPRYSIGNCYFSGCTNELSDSANIVIRQLKFSRSVLALICLVFFGCFPRQVFWIEATKMSTTTFMRSMMRFSRRRSMRLFTHDAMHLFCFAFPMNSTTPGSSVCKRPRNAFIRRVFQYCVEKPQRLSVSNSSCKRITVSPQAHVMGAAKIFILRVRIAVWDFAEHGVKYSGRTPAMRIQGV